MASLCCFEFPLLIRLIILAILILVQSLYAGTSSQGKIQQCRGVSPLKPSTPPMSNRYVIRLAEAEERLFETLRQLLHSFTDEGNAEIRIHIERFVEDYERSSGLVTRETSAEWPSPITQNPLLVFRMIFRFVIDLKALEAGLGKNENAGLMGILRILQLLENDGMKPDTQILEEAMARLLVIVHTYNLAVSQVAQGIFLNTSTGFNLERRHCITIGEYASKSGYHALAVEWVKLAQEMRHGALSDKSQEQFVETFLQSVVINHDIAFEQQEQEGTHTMYKFFMDKIQGGEAGHQVRQRTYYDRDTDELATYYGICGGRNYQSVEIKRKLYCWYDHKIHPEFLIAPLKVELLSRNPLLFQFYDIISKGDAQKLIDVAEPRLVTSRVYNRLPNHANGHKTPGRTSFGTYVTKEQSSAAARLLARTHHITKLDPSQGALELVAYTTGGHYHLHHDSVRKEIAKQSQGTENRLSTFMTYLSDVESGGITAFPLLGIGLKPVVGSGVFWYNLDKEEEMDDNLTHAGCPVILGPSKWIANMWIDVRGQFLTWKCRPQS